MKPLKWTSVLLQSAQPCTLFTNIAERNIKFHNVKLAGLYPAQLDNKVKMKPTNSHFECIFILLSFLSLSFICVVSCFHQNKDVFYMTEISSAKAQVGYIQTKLCTGIIFFIFLCNYFLKLFI